MNKTRKFFRSKGFHRAWFAATALGLLAAKTTQAAINLEIRSVLDTKRSGGTASGSFLESAAPNFLIKSAGGGFAIQNSSGGGAGTWAWRASGELEPLTLATIEETESWTTGPTPIVESPLGINEDRHNPTSVAYLYARLNDDYYGFRLGLWDGGNRLRLYGVDNVDVIINTNPVPEASAYALLFGLAGLSLVALKRRHTRKHPAEPCAS